MTNYSFLRKYQELQYTVMYDKLIELDSARIGYCKLDKSTFWNFALTNKILSQEEISIIEHELQDLDRRSAIYFENKNGLKELADFLTEKGYKKDYEDSWMFYKG